MATVELRVSEDSRGIVYAKIYGMDEGEVCWSYGATTEYLKQPLTPDLLELMIAKMGIFVISQTKRFDYKFPFATAEIIPVPEPGGARPNDLFQFDPERYIGALKKAFLHALEG